MWGRTAVASATQAQLRDQRAIALEVVALQVAEEPPAASDHLQQAHAGMVVLRVGAEVLGQIVDLLGQQRYLHLGRAGVAVGPSVLADQLGLLVLGQGHLVADRVAVTRRHARRRRRPPWRPPRPASWPLPAPRRSGTFSRRAASLRTRPGG